MRVYSEEVELDGRDPEQDYLLYKESCEGLATLMSEIQDLKANGAKEGVRITQSGETYVVLTCDFRNKNIPTQQSLYTCSLW